MGRIVKLGVAMLAMGLGASVLGAQQVESVRPVDIEINKLSREWDRQLKARQYDAAIAAASKAAQLAEGADGADSERAGHLHTYAGSAYLDKGDRAGAKAAYQRAFAIFERKYGQRLPTWGCYIPALIGSLSESFAELDARISYYERAVACYETTPTPGTANAVESVYQLSHAYRTRPARTDLVAKAAPLFDRWIALAVRDLGPDHIDVVRLQREQGRALVDLKEADRARAVRLRALAIAAKQADPAKPDKARLALEAELAGDLAGALTWSHPDHIRYSARKLAAMETLHGPSHAHVVAQRDYVAKLLRTFPEAAATAGVLTPSPPPAPVRQAVAPPAPAAASGGGGRVVHAAGPAGKPVWPTGMETGNLYFVVSGNTDGTYRHEDVMPIMVAAGSGSEAVERLRLAHLKSLVGGRFERNSVHARLIEGGECKGPVWGAVVSNSIEQGAKNSFVWGGGCGKTPAQAIEAAFAACRKHGSLNCESVGDPFPERREVTLALSGRSSWSGYYCVVGCTPSPWNNFGSFNAFTEGPFNVSPIKGMDDAIARLGTACRDQPCYLTTTSVRCFDQTAPDVRIAKCTDARLTREGYGGPIR